MTILVDRYKEISLLGEGASGKVFLAEHISVGRKVALKILDRSLAKESKFIERFTREAEVLAKFSHPHSVELLDFGVSDDGQYFMAMEYCEGRTLTSVLDDEKKISKDRALNIIKQLLEVLHSAHQAGIIHRDIKPDNLMLSPVGDELKVLDFGVAKIKERTSTMTLEGAAVGTPQYMSPEQASGDGDVDHRADLYSAGVVLFEMLSGFPPYVGKNMMHTLLMVMTQPAPALGPDIIVGDQTRALVKKALEKDKNSRFQSAEEFMNAITLAEGEEITQSSEIQKKQVTVKDSSKTRIVCLDDQEMIINIMKHLLEHEGYEVFTSTDWSVINDFIFSNSVDMVITDVEMPGLKGTAVCRILKQAMPALKVILFSNIPERDLAKLADESNADAWISKNSRPPDWLKSIKEVLAEGVVS